MASHSVDIGQVRESMRMLGGLADRLGTPAARFGAFESLVRRLCPPADLLDSAPIGVWLGATVDQTGDTHFKVYVNQEVGVCAARYVRVAACLLQLGRTAAVERLRTFVEPPASGWCSAWPHSSWRAPGPVA